RRLAEEEARRLAEEEARRLAEEEARRLAEAEEARRLAEEQEARRLAEEQEARRLADKKLRPSGVSRQDHSASLFDGGFSLSPDLLGPLEHDECLARVKISRAQQDDFLLLARDYMISMRAVEEASKNEAPNLRGGVSNEDDGWGDDDFDEEEVHFSKPSSPARVDAVQSKQVVLEEDDDDKWSDW
ncbi:vesicular transport-associated repeat protein, partial [Trypanosoma theileri]